MLANFYRLKIAERDQKITLTAPESLSPDPKTDLMAEVAEAIFCLSCNRQYKHSIKCQSVVKLKVSAIHLNQCLETHYIEI